MDLQTITHPDDRAETPQKMEELASGRISSFAQVKRYVRKDGGIIWVNITISPLWAKGDEPDFAMAAIEDVTDRKRAEDALAISEERYRTLFELSLIHISEPTRLGMISYAVFCLKKKKQETAFLHWAQRRKVTPTGDAGRPVAY